MSLTKEYEELDKIRHKEGDESKDHYLSVNLPGDRTMTVDTEGVRARIAQMAKEKAKPNVDTEKAG